MKLNLVIFFLFLVLCDLGCWQLSRAHQKEILITQRIQASEHAPLNRQDLLKAQTADIQHLPVKLTGHFYNQHQILLDNVIKNGQVGYQLYLPLVLNENTLILIERQFIPQGPSRSLLPEIHSEMGEVTIEGYLDFAYRNPFVKNTIESARIQWPLLVQQLDEQLLGKILGKTVFPMLVKSKLTMEFPTSPAKHRAYAVQWFGLAGALLVVYFFARRQKGARCESKTAENF